MQPAIINVRCRKTLIRGGVRRRPLSESVWWTAWGRLPRRWRALELAGPRQQRFIAGPMRLIRRLGRHSRPRLRFLFHKRLSDTLFGLLAIAGTAPVSGPTVQRPGHATRPQRRRAVAQRALGGRSWRSWQLFLRRRESRWNSRSVQLPSTAYPRSSARARREGSGATHLLLR